MTVEYTDHAADLEGLGRMPGVFYAVKLKARHRETGKLKTFVFTFDRKPAADRQAQTCAKYLSEGESVEVLRGEVAWESLN